MNNIGNFLGKILHTISASREQEHKIITSIKHIIGVSLSKDMFSVKDSILKIKTHPAIKQEILIQKELLLLEFKKHSLEITDVQ